ncbi:MAG: undecaprenyl-diphosphate phosphatase [Lacunisphaera sp.]
MIFLFRILASALFLAGALVGSVEGAEKAPSIPIETTQQPVAELSASNAVVLGLIEGITEFLPVSSTGHLIIATKAMGLVSEKQLTDAQGQPLWYKKPSPKRPDGVPLTIKLAADTYTVIIQIGAIIAVVLLYWRQLLSMAVGVVGRSNSGARLLRNIVLATVPVAILGLSFNDWISDHLFSVPAVIGAQVAGAFLMLWAERWRKANTGIGYSRNDPSDLTPKKAVGIGFAQCLALWPGTSRSMVTIVGGYLAGLTPVKSAEFSFLVGLPVLAGAALLKAIKSGPAMVEVFGWANLLLGGLVAAVSAAIAVKFLVAFLSRNGLALFAYYRLALALVIAAFFLF